VAEVRVLCERVSLFGLFICGNRDFFAKLGAEQVIRPNFKTKRKETANKSTAYITSLFFGRTGAATPERRLPVERNRKSHRQKQAILLGERPPRVDRPGLRYPKQTSAAFAFGAIRPQADPACIDMCPPPIQLL
jgi:hypothetical protein